jgi:Lrp/AsnC family transcriptional regulator
MKLDPIDRHLLTLLQVDATLSIQDLAERVGLTPNPCWRRIRRLEESGVIQRRVAVVDAAAVGLRLTAFVAIRTDKHSKEWLQSFARGIRAIPEIVECHRMSGETDYLLKVIVRDIAHYDEVYQRLIAEVDGLSDVSSAFSMESLKRDTAIDVATAVA